MLVPITSEEKPTACMSFNYHMDNFGKAGTSVRLMERLPTPPVSASVWNDWRWRSSAIMVSTRPNGLKASVPRFGDEGTQHDASRV